MLPLDLFIGHAGSVLVCRVTCFENISEFSRGLVSTVLL